MLWQAETAMYFRMVRGYTGTLIPKFCDWPIVDTFFTAAYLPDAGAQLSAFIAGHTVSVVVVADDDPDAQAWQSLASACCATKQSPARLTPLEALRKSLLPASWRTRPTAASWSIQRCRHRSEPALIPWRMARPDGRQTCVSVGVSVPMLPLKRSSADIVRRRHASISHIPRAWPPLAPMLGSRICTA
jgi:hypothetical protein